MICPAVLAFAFLIAPCRALQPDGEPALLLEDWHPGAPAWPAPPACSSALRAKIAWGAATAAYQIEGAWNEGGRSESVWDVWTHTPNKTYQNTTGDVACNHYHRWREDIQLMRALGLKHYRLSLSWTRIIPGGVRGSPVNPEGIRFYKQLLAGLRAEGIEPLVTLFHWDLPQVLQDAYGGFASEQIVEDFVYYADTVFRELGRFVTSWLTFNEPLVVCDLGFKAGLFPPGLKQGNAAMYRCGHNTLLAHAAVAQHYRQHYQATQHGRLSMASAGFSGIPADSSSPEDAATVELMMATRWGWFTDPVMRGDYPPEVRTHFSPDVLPPFTPEQQRLLRGSVDFLAVNIYTSRFIKPGWENEMPWVETIINASGDPLGADTDVAWLKVSPEGLRSTLAWVSRRYGGTVELMITENGMPVPGESELPVEAAVRDDARLDFYHEYLEQLCLAVAEDGANVSAYFAWSLLDNLEWNDGFRPRFGIVHVDFAGDLARTPKQSALWLSQHFFKAGREGVCDSSIHHAAEA